MTLIEALVVVAITALITAIGFVSFRADGAAAAWRGTSAALVAEVRAARATAIRTDAPALLEVAPDGRSFGRAGTEPVAALGKVRALASGPIRFFADGSATGGTIILSDGDRSATLAVDGPTGLIGFQPAAAR